MVDWQARAEAAEKERDYNLDGWQTCHNELHARAEAAEQRCVLLTKQRDVLETALLKIAHQDAKLTWARGVARAALDASFLLTKESSDA